MINDLHYAVTFPTNGVSLSGQISFQPGSTAITGDNGAGKSFVAEMIRYGLFGKKALRGPASDYKSLDMALGFVVNGQSYRVHRAKKEELTDGLDDEVLAVGADAVNKKIVEILGFDLEVFDVVCAANQKESERLTRLTPAKRKELIDEVVGLTRQEAVEKACREEAKGLAREAEALSQSLVLPVEPEKPKGYHKSEKIKDELDKVRAIEERVAELRRILDAVGEPPAEPTAPAPDLPEIEQHERERERNAAVRESILQKVTSIPEPFYTQQQIKEAQDLNEYDAAVAHLPPKPSIDETTFILKEMLDTWNEIDTLKRVGRLELHCPKCRHAFCPAHELPDEPEYSRREIEDELKSRAAWAAAPREPEGQRIPPAELSQAIRALDRADEKRLALEELDRLPELEDRSEELAEARKHYVAWELYKNEVWRYRERLKAAKAAQTELDETPLLKVTSAELDAAFVSARVYETQLANYSEQKQRFDSLTNDIGEKQQRAEEFLKGAKGLVEARRTLKAFLAPSLSRVASQTITQMTESSLRPIETIYVDEDMNITADGQDVSTFNGAHATMINLALRLALGQVLVARVFPVFIGDEIDSDATPANAQAIADGLMACKEQLKQIVLISHKELSGTDYEVML